MKLKLLTNRNLRLNGHGRHSTPQKNIKISIQIHGKVTTKILINYDNPTLTLIFSTINISSSPTQVL